MAGSVLITTPTARAEYIRSSDGGFWASIGLGSSLPDCAPEVPQGSPLHGTGPGWLSGFVWSDDNNDGKQQPNELGLPNVNVLLYALNLSGDEQTTNTKSVGDPIAWTRTGPDGSYLFTNLDPGIYKVVEEQPVAFVDGQDVSGEIFGVAGNAPLGVVGFADEKNSFVIPLPEEGYGVDFNFGEWGLSGGYVSKRMLMDGNPPVIPEPSTLWLVCAAGACLCASALRRRKAKRRVREAVHE